MSRPMLFMLPAFALLVALSACQMPPKADPDATPTETLAEYSVNLTESIDARNVKSLTISTGPGSLEIIAEDGLQSIEIAGWVGAKAASRVEAERLGKEVVLQVRSAQTENPVVAVTSPRIASSEQTYRYDVVVRVPSRLRVSVEDSEGDVTIAGVLGGVRLTNASGEVRVSGVGGGLELDNSGGPTRVSEVTGRVAIRDGKGDLVVSGVTGDIEVDDADGSLRIQNISGNVIARDNPTAVVIRNIEGDLTLVGIATSAADIQGVTGGISFPAGR